MKKLFIICFLVLLLIPAFAKAETCDTKDISIASIEVLDKTESSVEKEKPTIENNSIKFNLDFVEVDDYINYKLVIKNESKNQFDLNKTTISDDYIEYSIKVEDDSTTIDPGESKTIFLNINYKNKVDESSYVNDTYTNNKTFTLDLLKVDDNIENPETGIFNPWLIIIAVLIVISVVYFITKRKNYTKYMVLLLILLPIFVSAACSYNINVESNVSINKKNYIYTSSDRLFNVGYSVQNEFISSTNEFHVEFYTNYNLALTAFRHEVFIRHLIVDNEINKSYVGYFKDNKVHYLQGGTEQGLYEKNKNELLKIFGVDNCTEIEDNFICSDPDTTLEMIIGSDGYTEASQDQYVSCVVYANDSSECWEPA